MVKQTYKCWCHVCEREYQLQSIFLSTPLAKQMPDGRRLPVRSCGHSGAEVRAAFIRFTGGTPEQVFPHPSDGKRK